MFHLHVGRMVSCYVKNVVARTGDIFIHRARGTFIAILVNIYAGTWKDT